MRAIRCELCGASTRNPATAHVCRDCQSKCRMAADWRQRMLDAKTRETKLVEDRVKMVARLNALEAECAAMQQDAKEYLAISDQLDEAIKRLKAAGLDTANIGGEGRAASARTSPPSCSAGD